MLNGPMAAEAALSVQGVLRTELSVGILQLIQQRSDVC